MNYLFKGTYNIKNLNNLNSENLNNNIWVSKTRKRILHNKKKKSFIINSPTNLFLNLLFHQKKNIKILDFGAGSLDLYFDIINNFLSLKNFKGCKVTLDIVEVPKLIQMYKKLKFFNKKIKINFLSHDSFKKKYDIVHISDSLHYINQPQKFIINLINTQSEYIILNNTRLGKNATFATFQTFYKYKIPTWFFNEKQILKLFEKKYSVLVNINFLNKFFDKYAKYPMKNFKKKNRIEYTKTIILKKNNVS